MHILLHPATNLPMAVAAPKGAEAANFRRLRFACQRCASSLEALASQSGQPGRCPTCGAVFVVPAVDPQTGHADGVAAVPDDGQLPTPVHAYATAGRSAPRIVRRADGTQVIVCPRCRREMPVDADACTGCGQPFTIEGASQPAGAVEPLDNNLAVAALTVGVLGVLSFCAPVLAPVAIGLGVAGIRRATRLGPLGTGYSMALAGIILGLVAIALFTGMRLLTP